MNIGIIARSEDRGLGIQTWEICRHLDPAKVFVVDMGELAGRFDKHVERYEQWDSTVIPYERIGERPFMARLLDGLDVVYTAETFYKWQLCDVARALDVATVCHLNPEFHGHHIDLHEPRPTQWWLPSRWLMHDERIPDDAHYVPMPCPTDRWPEPAPLYDGSRPLRVLHISGHAAMGDRNGTRTLLAALKEVRQPMEVTVTTQDGSLPSPGRLKNVTYRMVGAKRDYWKLYEGYDVLVIPRRYGGLCLPAIEAAGAGLALVMSDVSPNGDYPARRIAGSLGSPLKGKVGEIPTFTTDARQLAKMLDTLAVIPGECADLQMRSRRWADINSWDNARLGWMEHFAAAVDEHHG